MYSRIMYAYIMFIDPTWYLYYGIDFIEHVPIDNIIPVIKMNQVVSFPLALSRTGQSLYCSLHKCSNPFALSKRLKGGVEKHNAGATPPPQNNSSKAEQVVGEDNHELEVHRDDSTLALLNARRIVGISQLCAAANLACQRPTSPTWDAVFLAAASTHLGHVLRDYAFVPSEENDHAEKMKDDDIVMEEKEYMVIVFMISSSGLEWYQSLLEKHGLSDSILDLEDYLRRQRETSAQEFQSWYKLTAQELASSSLEACVLTKIATKMA